MDNKRLYLALKIALLLGIGIGLFLVYEKFLPEGTEVCKALGEGFDCGVVNKSVYSTVDGIFYLMAVDWGWPVPIPNIPIPVSILGVLMLGFILYVVWMLAAGKQIFGMERQKTLLYLRILMVFNVLFGGYLFLVQKFLLKTYCIFCLSLDLMMVIALILVFMIRGDE